MRTSIWTCTLLVCLQLVISGGEPVMFFSKSDTIYVYFLETDDTLTLIRQAGRVRQIAFGPNNTVYWIDSETTSVFSVQYDLSYRTGDQIAIVDTGLISPSGLAVDWMNSNIYIVDADRREIIVCSVKGDNCAVLLKTQQQPRDIVIDTQSRRMYWLEGTSGMRSDVSVYEAYVDGTGRRQVYHAASRVSNLLLDVRDGSLYWLSEGRAGWAVLVMNPDKGSSKVVTLLPPVTVNVTPRMALFSDTLYVVTGNQTRLVSKETGKQAGAILTGETAILSTCIFDEAVYKINSHLANKCSTSPCSHLCVDGGRDVTVTCLCPVHMGLTSDNRCQATGSESLLVSGYFGIFRLPTKYIGADRARGKMLIEGHVVVVTFEPVARLVIFFDDQDGAIKTFPLGRPSDMKTLYKARNVEAIAVDVTDHVIYWTTLPGKVYAGHLDGSNVTQLLDLSSKPRGITLDTKNRFMYISTWGRDSAILRCRMDGSQCSVIMDVPGGHPNMVVLATEARDSMLFWTDSKLDLVAGIRLNIPHPGIEIVVKGTRSSMHPFALTVTDDYFYFTDLNFNTVHVVERSNVSNERVIAPGLGSLYSVVVIDPGNSNPETIPPLTRPAGMDDSSADDSGHVAVVIGLVGGLLVMATLAVAIFWWHRRSRNAGSFTLGLMRYVKAKKEDDSAKLVPKSLMMSQNFQNFEDLDYPVHDGPIHKQNSEKATPPMRELSIISADSAFLDNSSVDSSPLLM